MRRPPDRRLRPEPALGALGAGGAALLLGWLAPGGAVGGVLGGALGGLLGYALWRLASTVALRSGRARRAAQALGAVPLLPWLAGWPLALQATIDPLARAQLAGAGAVVAIYLGAWSALSLAGVALWVGAVPPSPRLSDAVAEEAPPARPAPGAWWLAVPLLALGGVSYWNGAVLDPLQFRGFPDYVTQMGGARRLLAGALPYNPDIRVWTDVNLPPITLLLLFAPFTPLSELGGKLAYFLVNHVAFGAGVAVLLAVARPPAQVISPLLWAGAVLAMALTFEPWHDSLRLGQQNGIVLLCLALSLAGLLTRRTGPAGVALAAALIGKPSSALLGLYLLLTRRWRAALAAALAGLAAFLLTLPWAGWENWRFYLLEKAPEIVAGTPQQSNVALLALHARLFLPPDALSSFDAMPALPSAQTLTRVAQLLGLLALWRLTATSWERSEGPGRLALHLEFAVALVLSLSLVGHAWQSYVTWLLVAFVPLADPRAWGGVRGGRAPIVGALVVAAFAGIALYDVALYKTIGNASAAATVFASLPNVMLLVLAFALALLRGAVGRNTE